MRVYLVSYINGVGVGGIGRPTAPEPADAIELAEHWARRTVELTDEDGTVRAMPFPRIADGAA